MASRWDPVQRKWVSDSVKGTGTDSTPIRSAADQKKLDDEERGAFETETGQKYGWNSQAAFTAWKAKRKKPNNLSGLMGGQ